MTKPVLALLAVGLLGMATVSARHESGRRVRVASSDMTEAERLLETALASDDITNWFKLRDVADSSITERLLAIIDSGDAAEGRAFRTLVSSDRHAAMAILEDADGEELSLLVGELWLADVASWEPSDRDVVLDAVRRAFPDDWELDAGWCGNAYGHPGTHSKVFAVIGRCGPAAEPMLADLLDDRRPIVRVNVAFVLRSSLDREGRLRLLARAMDDDDPRVREVAAASLEAGCARGGLEVLRAHLHDDDKFVRRRVAMAMASWGDAEAIPVLIDSIGLSHCGPTDCAELTAYEQIEAGGGVLDALERATLHRPSPPATDPYNVSRDPNGGEPERQEWSRWWSEHEQRHDVTTALREVLLTPPTPTDFHVTARVVARVNDPECLAMIRQSPAWSERFEGRLGVERAELLQDDEVISDPFAEPFSRGRSEVVERLMAHDPGRLRHIIERGMASNDVGVIGSTWEATRWGEIPGLPEPAAWREALRRAAAESAPPLWTENALELLAEVGTSEDCALLDGLPKDGLAYVRLDLETALGCSGTR